MKILFLHLIRVEIVVEFCLPLCVRGDGCGGVSTTMCPCVWYDTGLACGVRLISSLGGLESGENPHIWGIEAPQSYVEFKTHTELKYTFV